MAAKSERMRQRAYMRPETRQVLFVDDGIDGSFGTFIRKATGSLQRVKSQDLPMRATIEEAQADLDAYAAKHKLPDAMLSPTPIKSGKAKQAAAPPRPVPLRTTQIDIMSIDFSPFQPRVDFPLDELTALGESLRSDGQVHPIAVRETPGKAKPYELVDGEKRLRGAGIAGVRTLRAEVWDIDDAAARAWIVATAAHRSGLNPIEQARAFTAMLEAGDASGPSQLAERLHLSQGHVSNTLALLKLPGPWQGWIMGGRITARHARSVVAYCEDPRYFDAMTREMEQQIEAGDVMTSSAWERRVEWLAERVSSGIAGEADEPEDGGGWKAEGGRQDAEEAQDGEESTEYGVRSTEQEEQEDSATVLSNPQSPIPNPLPVRSFAATWRADMLRQLVAQELPNATPGDVYVVILLGLWKWQTGNGYQRLESAVMAATKAKKVKDLTEAVLAMKGYELDQAAGLVASKWFYDDATGEVARDVADEDVERIAEMLGVDIEGPWISGDLSPAREYWEGHTVAELRDLAAEVKVKLPAKASREAIVAELMEAMPTGEKEGMKMPKELKRPKRKK